MRSPNVLIGAVLAVFTAVVAAVATEPIGATAATGAVPGTLALAFMLGASTLLLHQFLRRGGARLLLLSVTLLSCAALAARGAATDGAWAWLAWHVLLPAGIAVSMWGGPEAMRSALAAPGAARAAALGMSAALVVAGALLSLSEVLPERDDPSSLSTGVGIGAAVAAAAALAFVALRARRGDIERWLVVCAGVALSAIVLGLIAGERGTIGWWAARATGDLAVLALLLALWHEYRRLYRKLARAGEHLREQAGIDPVTQVLTREAVLAQGVRLLPGLERDDAPLTLAIVAVEDFDVLVSRHGSPAGDRVLAEVAKRIAAALRDYDVVGRLDEAGFLLLLPDASVDGGRVALERVVGRVRSRPISSLRSTVPVRIGVGVAQVEPGRTEIESTIERARRALGSSRAQGSGRILTRAEDYGQPPRASAPPPGSERRSPAV